ncbi:hypothetical protein MM440_01945 [Arsenicicoccus piscis]|uniref:hypothetical protein n=1 Tax=Arsenicicoccus piscis TaxID=673954 RepID=UPI001F4C8D93|nr:hypothetical protein [Arsenicicoccus piscis]MCH8626574.1 hypothetical protein [Arsenicicoccus piscis]
MLAVPLATGGTASASQAAGAPALPATTTASATATSFTPGEWRVDQTQRRFFTAKLGQTVCDGMVNVTLYDPHGGQVDWLSQSISSCTSSVRFDENVYDYQAFGHYGIGKAKVEVLDFNGSGGPSSRDFTFAIKNNSTQNIRSSRSGSYVTVAGTTMRYIQPTEFHSYWTPGAGLPVQYQQLVGTTWKTIRTTTTNAQGNSSIRIYAPKKATYRVVFPATGYATLAGSMSGAQVR